MFKFFSLTQNNHKNISLRWILQLGICLALIITVCGSGSNPEIPDLVNNLYNYSPLKYQALYVLSITFLLGFIQGVIIDFKGLIISPVSYLIIAWFLLVVCDYNMYVAKFLAQCYAFMLIAGANQLGIMTGIYAFH